MDIFSLISLENLQDPQEEDAAGQFANENSSNDGSETNRKSESLTSSNTIRTPQSLFSIPPRSPPKTPPRPTSHIDDRIRIRRYKSLDISFSSAADDDDECFDSNPVDSPNASPNKNDLSLSPLQERLARARDRRQMILKERVQHIDNKCKEKEQLANKRKEDATIEKVIKARRELAKSPIAKERRDQQLAFRVQSVEATLESRTALAQSRLKRHLFEKQRRACCKERMERADRRRMIISYEKRAKLLATLDAKHERATLNSHRLTEKKATKAGEDIVKAKEVARRVKACRTIQGLVREAYGLEVPNSGNLDLSQHGAARRLQKWVYWRAFACERRLFADSTGGGVDSTPKAALEKLIELFPLEPQGKRHSSQPPPFEHISQLMMKPETLKKAKLIVDCFRPLICGGAQKSSPMMDSRTFLALFLIAVHPHEVLGSDFDTKEDRGGSCSRALAAHAKKMLVALRDLLNFKRAEAQSKCTDRSTWTWPEVRSTLVVQFIRVSTLLIRGCALFSAWKSMDLDMLLENLSKQLEQSWVVYLTSCETLKYLADVTDNVVHGPLMSLKIRHEAGRAGSRAHIKRIRLSLNKLLGEEAGKEVVKTAKMVASQDIEKTNIMQELKDEIDEIHGGLGTAPDYSTGNVNLADSDSMQGMAMAVDVPQEVLSNVATPEAQVEELIGQGNMALDRQRLVHNIMLTDPSDFHTLSWDGTSAQQPNESPEEFMASFLPRNNTAVSMEDMPAQITRSMRLAFFNQVTHEMGQGSFESVRELLKEVHTKMRSLIPSRQELHSRINDEDVFSCSSTSDIIRVLIRSGSLLANYLESAARASSTRELIECLERFNYHPSEGSNRQLVVPYGLVNEEMFAVASIAYILHKTELCQADIRNFELSQVAPTLTLVGHDYERIQFQNIHGNYTSSTTIEELQQMLPSTWTWVKNTQLSSISGESLTTQSSLEQKFDVLKGRGFVDGLLFARTQLTLPELFSLDVERIGRIRSEARCCVIASALALHACNISRVRSSALGSAVMSDDARHRLSAVLRRRHFDQRQLEQSVIDAIGAVTKAAAGRDLSEDESAALSNHTHAVLHGKDPVLKLLDNRIQGFFRFACRWKPCGGNAAPPEMRTGRSTLGAGDDAVARHGINSTKGEFLSAATREASRLGFADFACDLIDAGNEARGIINLACVNYGRDILDRFLTAACEVNHVNASG